VIRRIAVDNFKALRNFSVELDGDLVLFTGENGTGKSSVLSALEVLLLRGGGIPVPPPDWSATIGHNAEPQKIALDFDSAVGNGRYELEIVSANRIEPRVLRETALVRGRPCLQAEPDGDGLLVTVAPTSKHRERVHLSADHPALFSVAATGDNAAVRDVIEGISILSITPEEVSSDQLTRWPRSGNFTEWLRRVDLASRERIFSSLREVMTGFAELRFDGTGAPPSLRAFFSFNGREEAVPFVYLSEGQRMLCALYAVAEAMIENGTTLFIDEPENFVSSRELQPWLRAVEDRLSHIATEGGSAQVVLVSHHPELLDQLARARGVWFERASDGRIVARRWSDEYPNLNPSEVVARGWAGDQAE
jgi:ABC-type branched-subunit amino acid transport system ATPase component